MRTKDDILVTFDKMLDKGAKEQEIALSVAYQFLEVLIDMRDIYSQALIALDRIIESLEQLK